MGGQQMPINGFFAARRVDLADFAVHLSRRAGLRADQGLAALSRDSRLPLKPDDCGGRKYSIPKPAQLAILI
jgi:hypothetical protein